MGVQLGKLGPDLEDEELGEKVINLSSIFYNMISS